MRLHIQGLQRIDGVTKAGIGSLQATYQLTDALMPCIQPGRTLQTCGVFFSSGVSFLNLSITINPMTNQINAEHRVAATIVSWSIFLLS
jgi:hypothetical protein